MRTQESKWTLFPELRGMALGLLFATLLAAAPIAGQTPGPEDGRELAATIEESFRVLPLSDGLLLEPRRPIEGVAVIEVRSGEVAIDGQQVPLHRLEEELGSLAEPVRRLGSLSDAERRRLFSDDFDEDASEEEARHGARADVRAAAEEAREDARAAADEARRDALEAAEEAREDALAAAEEARELAEEMRAIGDPRVTVGGSLTVDEDEVVEEAVVIGGSLRVLGRVDGDAVVIGGRGEIRGVVEGDFSVVGGEAVLGPESRVDGDVAVVGGHLERHPGAEVGGEVSEVALGSAGLAALAGGLGGRRHWEPPSATSWVLGVFWFLVWLLVEILLACLALLLARRPIDRIGERLRAEPWKSGLVGLVAEILFIPVLLMVFLLLLISVIGWPLLPLVPIGLLVLLVLAFFGYVAAALGVGDWIRRRLGWEVTGAYRVLILGLLLISSFGLIGQLLDFGPLKFFSVLLTILGCVVGYVAWTVGLGAMLLTRFGSRGDLGPADRYDDVGGSGEEWSPERQEPSGDERATDPGLRPPDRD